MKNLIKITIEPKWDGNVRFKHISSIYFIL